MAAWWSPAVRLRPGWTARIVLPLTLAYLVVEFAFNGRLLDVTGGLASPGEIGVIEHVGRALSGIALALVFWKAIIRRAERRGLGLAAFLGLLMASALLSMAAMYVVQKGLIDYLVDRSTGTERRTAIRIRLMTNSIIEQDAAIDGIELTPAVMASPEGKSFLSLLPIMTFLHGDADGSVTGMLRQLARLRIEAAIGTAESSYTNVFVPSAEAIVDSYNAYADGVNRYRQALLAIPARQAAAWAGYEDGLRRRGRPRPGPGTRTGCAGAAGRPRGFRPPSTSRSVTKSRPGQASTCRPSGIRRIAPHSTPRSPKGSSARPTMPMTRR